MPPNQNQNHEKPYGERIAQLETRMDNQEERQNKMEKTVDEISKVVWKGVGAVFALVSISELVHYLIQLHK